MLLALRMSALLLVVLTTLGCHAQEQEDRQMRPLPLDLTLGKNINDIRADIRKRFGSDEGLDGAIEEEGYRFVAYTLQAPESFVAINVRYAYRPSDGVVWGISVAYAYGVFTGDLGGVNLDDSLAEIEEKLGKPLARREEAPVIDAYWWETETLGYAVHAYSEEYGIWQPGDIGFLEVWRRDLAPPGYDGDRTLAP